MASYLDMQMLSDLVRTRRGNRGLREIAPGIRVSPATISRVERGAVPDLETFLALCDWLEIPPRELIRNTNSQVATDNFDSIRAMLLGDCKLDPTIVDALIILLEVAYRRRQP